MIKININTAGLMMDCMSYAFVAAVTKERGTAPSDEEIHNAVKSLMTLYCRHERISAPIDEVPSEYTGIPTCPYLSPDEDEDWDEGEDEEEDEDEEEEDEYERDLDIAVFDFSHKLTKLLNEYNLHYHDDCYENFIDDLY